MYDVASHPTSEPSTTQFSHWTHVEIKLTPSRRALSAGVLAERLLAVLATVAFIALALILLP